MPNFLVVSYDPDQQQWFYDTVESANGDMAEAYILKLRDYVTCADANDLGDIRNMGLALKKEATNKTDDRLCECQDCGHITPESMVLEIKDLLDRVAAGETMPAGECPECGALASLIDPSEIYDEQHPQTDSHLAACPSCMMAHDKALPDGQEEVQS